jgi:hypothetical protein
VKLSLLVSEAVDQFNYTTLFLSAITISHFLNERQKKKILLSETPSMNTSHAMERREVGFGPTLKKGP